MEDEEDEIWTKLVATDVFRGGRTAIELKQEPTKCRFRVDGDGLLVFEFEIKSKGGGKTVIHFKVGEKDFEPILIRLAQYWPEKAPLFSRCANISSEELVRTLKKSKGRSS